MKWRPRRRVRPEYGLWLPEYDALAAYNAECARGVAHTPEYDAKMALVQASYDEEYLPQLGPGWVRSQKHMHEIVTDDFS